MLIVAQIMLFLAINALALTAPTALLQPLTPAAKLQHLSGLLLGSTVLQDERTWEVLMQTEGNQFSKIVDAAHVAPSPRHGDGLFASRGLPADTIVSFYPVHSIGLREQRLASNADDMDYWRTCSSAYRTPILHAAVQAFAPGAFVDVNLQRADRLGWLAHRANDATACLGSSETEILMYVHTCALECNCALVPFGGAAPILALVTTRHLAEGTELLCSYGIEHWAATRAETDLEPDTVLPVEESQAADEGFTAAAQSALDAFWDEEARMRRLDALAEKYKVEVEIFEGMVVLAAERQEEEVAAAAAAGVPGVEAPAAPAATNRKMRRSTKRAPGGRTGSEKVTANKKRKRKK